MHYFSRNIYCEGYLPDDKEFIDKTDLDLRINDKSDKDNINLVFQDLAQATINKDNRAFDLIRIAAYVYITDCKTERGGLKDAYDEYWNVDLNFFIPVLDPAFWNNIEVKELLSTSLGFAAGHKYNFNFVEWQPKHRKLFLDVFNENVKKLDIDCISMFSGGLDSLYSSTLLLENKRKPLLLSHRTTPKLMGFRKDLVELLSQDYKRNINQWEIPISNHKQKGVEPTQRSRSFVYACLGVAFARCLDLKDVYLSDNGIVTFNLKSTNQNVGSLNTRSTNPKLIFYVNKLSKLMWKDKAPKVENLLLWKTKAEVIKGLKDLNKSELLSKSTSCVSTMGLSKVEPYCGICSQCVDRRFSVEWNKLSEDEEPRKHYKVDIFRDDLINQNDKGIARTHSENYYRKAKFIDNADDMQFMGFYGELYDYIPEDVDELEFLQNVYDLHKRFAEQVFDVIGSFGKDYARGKFAEHSLINMIYGERNKREDINNYKIPEKKEIVINPKKRKFLYKDCEMDLTNKEFYFVHKLAEEVPEFVSYDILVDDDVYANEVAKEHKKNITKKFVKTCKDNYIQDYTFEFILNKRGFGYKLNFNKEKIEIL